MPPPTLPDVGATLVVAPHNRPVCAPRARERRRRACPRDLEFLGTFELAGTSAAATTQWKCPTLTHNCAAVIPSVACPVVVITVLTSGDRGSKEDQDRTFEAPGPQISSMG